MLIKCGNCLVAAYTYTYTIWKSHVDVSCLLVLCVCAFVGMNKNQYKMHGGDRGSTVVKVLRYKSEGRWFDPRWCHWIFPLT
jgi:hypothetical protein